MKPSILKALFFLSFVLAGQKIYAEDLRLIYLKGVIGKAENVEVFLAVGEQSITGTYFYKSKGRTIFLNGDFKQKGGNQFILTERTDDKHTGKFEGTIQKDNTWRGKWQSARKPVREFKFELHPVPEKEIDFAFKVSIKTLLKEVNPFCEIKVDTYEIREKQSPFAIVETPTKTLSDLLSTNELKTFCSAQPKGQCSKDSLCALEGEERVLYARNNIVSLDVSTYAYSGGAHGSSAHYFLNYDLLRKRNLSLVDLIDEKKWNEFKVKFQKKFKEYLKQNEIPESDFGRIPNVDEKTKFFLTDSSVFVFFDEDVAPSHAVGPIQIELTRGILEGFLKKEI